MWTCCQVGTSQDHIVCPTSHNFYTCSDPAPIITIQSLSVFTTVTDCSLNISQTSKCINFKPWLALFTSSVCGFPSQTYCRKPAYFLSVMFNSPTAGHMRDLHWQATIRIKLWYQWGSQALKVLLFQHRQVQDKWISVNTWHEIC